MRFEIQNSEFKIIKMFNLPKTKYFIIAAAILFFAPSLASAQSGLNITITPPLFQLTIDPGGTWSSSIRVLNRNPYPLTIYASPVNFHAQGDTGAARFTPRIRNEDEAPSTLAYWMDVSTEGVVIPSGESFDIPFTVRIPQDAPPGGHYASILIGNRPLSEQVREGEDGAVIHVGSMVASLFFVRVEGDVEERGIIREFFPEKAFYQKPETDFVLRFQNQGNVHLQPQGEITIYNMFGRERGKVPINQKTEFGNVLPETERKFNFTWRGEDSLFDIGRYQAQATLGFGQDGRQTVTRAAYFWIVPVVPLASVLGSIAFIVLISVWAVRSYVRKTLRSVGVATDSAQRAKRVVTPVETGAQDFLDSRFRGNDTHKNIALPDNAMSAGAVKKYKKPKIKINMKKLMPKKVIYILAGLLLVSGAGVVGMYLKDALTSERGFEVVVSREGGEDILITSEEEDVEEEREIELPEGFVAENYSVSVVNASVSQEEFLQAVAAIERAGFDLADVQTEASGESPGATIVRYRPEADEAAFILSQFFEGSMEEDAELETDLVVIIGG